MNFAVIESKNPPPQEAAWRRIRGFGFRWGYGVCAMLALSYPVLYHSARSKFREPFAA